MFYQNIKVSMTRDGRISRILSSIAIILDIVLCVGSQLTTFLPISLNIYIYTTYTLTSTSDITQVVEKTQPMVIWLLPWGVRSQVRVCGRNVSFDPRPRYRTRHRKHLDFNAVMSTWRHATASYTSSDCLGARAPVAQYLEKFFLLTIIFLNVEKNI